LPPSRFLKGQAFRLAGRSLTRSAPLRFSRSLKPSRFGRLAGFQPQGNRKRAAARNPKQPQRARAGGLALIRQIKKQKLLERQQQAAPLNVAPVRPIRGGVSISVEALYKMAAAAQRAGKRDEAETLYTAAELAADADERTASLKPQGLGELKL